MVTCTAWILKIYNPTDISEKKCIQERKKRQNPVFHGCIMRLNQAETLSNMQTALSSALVSSSISDWIQHSIVITNLILFMGTDVVCGYLNSKKRQKKHPPD